MSVPRASKPRTQPGLEGEEVSFQNLHSVFSEVSAKLPPHAMRGLIISPSGRKCWTSDQSRQERDQAQTSTWEDFQKGGQWINMSISANIALAIHWAFKKIRYRKKISLSRFGSFCGRPRRTANQRISTGRGPVLLMTSAFFARRWYSCWSWCWCWLCWWWWLCNDDYVLYCKNYGEGTIPLCHIVFLH